MKKTLLFLATLLFAIVLCRSTGVYADDIFKFKCDYYTKEAVLTGIDRTAEYVTIPSYYDGCKVVAIDMYHDPYSNLYVKSLYIPATVRTISRHAFANSYDLEVVTFESGIQLEELPYKVFVGCEKLMYINNFPAVKIIADYAFCGCKSILAFEIPDSVIEIGDCAFKGCKSIKSINIPGNVKAIGDGAFYESGVESVSGVDNVQQVGGSLFAYCTSLTKVDGKLKKVEDSMFYGCSKLSEIEFSDELTTIGSSAFAGTNISEVVLPGNVDTVSSGAFSRCENLKKVFFTSNPSHMEKAFDPRTKVVLYGLKNRNVEACARSNGLMFVGYDCVEDIEAKYDKKAITIKWEKVDGAETYQLYRCVDNSYKMLISTKENEYVDTDIKPGTVYKYYVSVNLIVDGVKINNVKSETIEQKTPEQIIVPKLEETAKRKVKITWNAEEGVNEYQIYRSTKANGTYKKIGTTKKLSYTDKNVTPGKVYYYFIGNGLTKEKIAMSGLEAESKYRGISISQLVVRASENNIQLNEGETKIIKIYYTGDRSIWYKCRNPKLATASWIGDWQENKNGMYFKLKVKALKKGDAKIVIYCSEDVDKCTITVNVK